MKKVIVVDDSSTARVQVKSVLNRAGFDVIEAVDGGDGRAMIEAHDDAKLGTRQLHTFKPDLLLAAVHKLAG